MTPVKKRHLSKVCKHMAGLVKSETGQQYTYEAVAP
jgi:hypothetical protein